MNMIELKRALVQLRLSGIAAILETRLHQTQTEPMAGDGVETPCPDPSSSVGRF
jgi:hypothetical protein